MLRQMSKAQRMIRWLFPYSIKRLGIARLLFFSSSLSLCGSCFQPVPGINLWQLTDQVGSCVDLYSTSILDELDIILCSVGNVVPLMQANFNAAFSITQPGRYKVCENITTSAPILLVIASNNVTLDLGGYYLDGVTIALAIGATNSTIQNGFMRNAPQFIFISPSTQDLLIQNIVFDTSTASEPAINLPVGPAVGLTIRDVTFYNTAPQNILLMGSSGNTISNALLENINCNSTNQALTATLGTNAAIQIDYGDTIAVNKIGITNPYQGLDCIYVTNSDNIKFDGVSIFTTLPLVSGTPAALRVETSNNMLHHTINVDGAGFAFGFRVSGTAENFLSTFSYDECVVLNTAMTGVDISYVSDVTVEQCRINGCVTGDGMDLSNCNGVTITDCATNANNGYGLSLNSCSDTALESHTAVGNNSDGIILQGSISTILENCFITQNGGCGLSVSNSNNSVIQETTAFQNVMQGFLLTSCAHVVIKESSSLANTLDGFSFNMVDDIVISASESQKNGGAGFNIIGVNGGSIPGDPEGTVGRSPVFAEGCSAYQNGNPGFYFSNVGGVYITGCFASYNNNYGFHFDTGSWNVQVAGCYATSNALNGFITWDVSELLLSSYNNRFRECYGSHNNTNFVYDTLGIGDFAENNATFTFMIAPIGAVYTASQLTTPDFLGVIAVNNCEYQ